MRDECRGDRKTWRWKHFGVSVKTFSAHIVVVFRLAVSGKRFSAHERVRGNRKIGENRAKEDSEQTEKGVNRDNREKGQ